MRRLIRVSPLLVLALAGAALLTLACGGNSNNGGTGNATSTGQPQTSAPATLGQRTKTSGCTVRDGLPDSACSPGAIFPSVTREQICTPGYAKSVRDVPTSEKDAVYAEYGIRSHRPGEYEVDHLVSLELGGSNDIANLWPEAAEPRPGFHEKDRFENHLHDQVCNGSISLQEAQRRIAENWLKYWMDAGQP